MEYSNHFPRIHTNPQNANYFNKWMDIFLGMPTKVYLASGFFNKLMIDIIHDWIENIFPHIEIVGNWFKSIANKRRVNRWTEDIQHGVLKADLVICFYPYGKTGTLQEMACAVSRQIPCIYFCPHEYCSYEEQPLVVDNFIKLQSSISPTFIHTLEHIPNGDNSEHTIKKAIIYELLNRINGDYLPPYEGGIVVQDKNTLINILTPIILENTKMIDSLYFQGITKEK